MKNVAVVGLGYWGPNLVRNILAMPEANLEAICDKDKTKLDKIKRTATSANRYTDFRQMIDEETDIDCILIATPPARHYELAKASLIAGKHVFVEKPMTLNVSHAEELVELSESLNKRLAVGHTFLYTGAVEKMKEIIESGEIGDVVHINTQRLNLGLIQNDGTNVVWDLMPHDTSIILYLIGKQNLIDINAHGSSHYKPGVEDVAQVELHFENGVTSHSSYSWIHPDKVRTFAVIGTKKMIVFNDIETNEKLRVYDTGVESTYQDLSGFEFAYRYGDVHIPKLSGGEALYKELRHFVHCVETGERLLTDGKSGCDVVKIISKVQEAMKRNNPPTM